ncbi:MAG: peptidoglycan-binding protein [Clostridia bacterium]|nr:peptidoglycan-binding protein [Clostridia bacterium]
MATVRIPDYITVHLGAPNDTSAPNVRVPFADYIKNVASSEIYPTWPETALRANILAQISFALNRVYTEFYRARGYDFDITSDTQFDQKYIDGREIFDDISRIVDDVYNDYIIREGTVQPLFARYCNGTTSTCDGLSQWGTVPLAEEGLLPYEILQYYYGDDIGIVFNAPIGQNVPTYPGVPLRLGSAGEDVRTVQRQLNRIGQNYPAIRPVLNDDGIFDIPTEQAVENFQRIFNLTPDGIVGKATWYKIKSIFNAVKGLAELESEGLTPEEVERVYAELLREGDTGIGVATLQHYLLVLATFDNTLPMVEETGVFGPETTAAVRAFQAQQGLAVDGIVGRQTWNALTRAYDAVIASLPPTADASELYPGQFLTPGQEGANVRALQVLLERASELRDFMPPVLVDGIYGAQTEAAVRAAQAWADIPQNGVVGPVTWDVIVFLADPDSNVT